MEFNNKKQALLYLDRNGFYFYEAGLPNILSLSFLETSVKDLDLVDEKSLDAQIQAFCTQSKLPSSVISIIISPNIIFEKDIFILEQPQQQEAVEKFINTVPFTNVSTAIYPIEKGVKAIGVNEDLFLAVKNSFEKIGNVSSLILPYHALGPDASLLNNFNADNLSQLLKRLDRLKPFNLLKLKILDMPQATTNSSPTIAKQPKINKRVIVMVGVFLVLVVIMIYMLINMK